MSFCEHFNIPYVLVILITETGAGESYEIHTYKTRS
jgi:hypothetical protein